MRYVYRVEYSRLGQRSVVRTYPSELPLAPGQSIAVGGAFLVVERVILAKRGDPYDGIAFCKLAMG